jgi:preprotein translocase subunit YajC
MLTACVAAPLYAQESQAPAGAPEAAAPAAMPSQSGAAQVTAGAQVVDSKGDAVGTITSVNGDVAVIDTGTVKASVPVSSFGKGEKGLLLGMTRSELEAAAKGAQGPSAQNTQAQAPATQGQPTAELKPGTAVVDAKGGAVGKIEAVQGDTVTVATPNVKARLPKSSIAMGPNGAVISMTQAQLEAAAKGAKSPAG